MTSEVIIYCDESDERGAFFSHFYGGVLVRSRDVDGVRAALTSKAEELHFHSEVKWSKVTENYLEKYIRLMDLFFDFVKQDVLKVRIMFTQNIHEAMGLNSYQRENAYFLHYYQFVKHSFGLQHARTGGGFRVRAYFDHLPDTREKSARFKDYISRLSLWPGFRNASIEIRQEDVVEVDSAEHILLQCLDIALGAMSFRLNDKHLAKPEGARVRGKRTIAKEKLYRHINERIRDIYPNFNVGVTTSDRGVLANRWRMPYRHWVFMPGQRRTDTTQSKGNQGGRKK